MSPAKLPMPSWRSESDLGLKLKCHSWALFRYRKDPFRAVGTGGEDSWDKEASKV
jgi:hypothetical protein